MGVKPSTVTGAVPALLDGIPVDDTFGMGTHRQTCVQLPLRIPIDRDLFALDADNLPGIRGDIGDFLRATRYSIADKAGTTKPQRDDPIALRLKDVLKCQAHARRILPYSGCVTSSSPATQPTRPSLA
jgi:hypothetical protein